MPPGDYATWTGAGIAAIAAVFAWYQAYQAKQQLKFAKSAAADDDIRRKKQNAIDLAEEWCRTEAHSPIFIMHPCLTRFSDEVNEAIIKKENVDNTNLDKLLSGRCISIENQFIAQFNIFLSEIYPGHTYEKFESTDPVVNINENQSELLRGYFTRRLNFLEVVAAGFNSGLDDAKLIKQFFAVIVTNNPAYRSAVHLRSDVWPELEKFDAALNEQTKNTI